MSRSLKENISILTIIIVIFGIFFIDYKKTELRIERLYKVNNPTFIEVMIEMFR